MRVGAERRELALEGDDFRERGGAVRVGEVTALGGFHHVAAAPEVVEGVVDGDRAHAVFVSLVAPGTPSQSNASAESTPASAQSLRPTPSPIHARGLPLEFKQLLVVQLSLLMRGEILELQPSS